MASVFFIFQKPESVYHDMPFERYDYPVSIPNGQKLQIEDLVVFDLTSKGALNLYKNKHKRITGFAEISEIIEYQSKEGEIRRIASYSWFYKFDEAISYEELGDNNLRANPQHSICAVTDEKKIGLLINLLKLKLLLPFFHLYL